MDDSASSYDNFDIDSDGKKVFIKHYKCLCAFLAFDYKHFSI